MKKRNHFGNKVLSLFLFCSLVIASLLLIVPIALAALNYGGSEQTYNSENTINNSVAKLDTNKFVVAYKDNDSLGKAVVCTVSGSTISCGSEYSFGITGGTGDLSVTALDTTHFVVAHQSTLGAYGTSTIGTVSGTTISYGSNYTFNATNTVNISTDLIDTNKFVVAYKDSDSLGKAIIGTVSGTAISYGGEASFGITGGTGSLSASALDSTRFVVAHQSTLGAYGTSTTGTVSGSSITFGSNYTFNSQNTDHIANAKIDTDKFVIAYRDAGDSPANYGKAIVGEYQEEEAAIPELPKNNVWKIVVAVLALVLVIGIAAWRKKKETPSEPEKK
jgi:hypothetical protein